MRCVICLVAVSYSPWGIRPKSFHRLASCARLFGSFSVRTSCRNVHMQQPKADRAYLSDSVRCASCRKQGLAMGNFMPSSRFGSLDHSITSGKVYHTVSTAETVFRLLLFPKLQSSTMVSLLVASFHNRPQLLHFNPDGATLELETLETPDFQDYTWISAHPMHKGLFYALQRYSNSPGILSIVKLSTSSNKSTKPPHLEIVKSYPSHGLDPCHLGISAKADKLAIANVNTSLSSAFISASAEERVKMQYDSSTVTIYSLLQDGMVDEDKEPQVHDLSKLEFASGPNEERQEAPHPHGCFYVPNLECFLAPDLGADKLRLIGKDRTFPCEAGAGPRHAVINSQGRFRHTRTS